MKKGKFTLRYLPKFREIVDYISLRLHNSDSALKLVNKAEQAIMERLTCSLSFEPFHLVKKRTFPYYRIYTENFTVYYVVIEEIMEIRRILYNKRNANQMIR